MSNKRPDNLGNSHDLRTKRKKLALNLRLAQFGRLALVVVMLLLLLTGLFDSQKKWLKSEMLTLSSGLGYRLSDIVIEGANELSQKDIFELANIEEHANILALDLDRIRIDIEQNNWVKYALIERKLPRTLYIGIVERQPIAVWQYKNKLSLIDAYGAEISRKNISKHPGLLQVVGSGANAHASMLIGNLNSHAELAKRVYAAVRVSDRRWNLHLEQDILVKMPAKDFATAYDRLASLHSEGKLFGKDIEYIDLRNPQKTYTKYL